jgi:DNA-binding NarL/FixJ family response regulator
MKQTRKIKSIFIVEDNEIYGKSLQGFIQSHFPDIKEVEVFKIGEMCLMELHRNPGIIIVDYLLNSSFKEAHNGLEIIKRIKAAKPLTKIIVLSGQEKFDVILEAIKEYDCSYVQKDNESFEHVEMLIKEFLSKNHHTLEPWA